jgi:tRNA (cmo5U34)-methyltransferase
MTPWSEDDATAYRSIADIAVPRRRELLATLVALVPFPHDEPIRVVELGCGDGVLACHLLEAFSRARVVAFDGSDTMREAARARLVGFGQRIDVRGFELESLDWWDDMTGADLVVSSMCLHHLKDRKKQYVYKAVAERLSPRGACLIADLVEAQHAVVQRLFADSWDANARTQAAAQGVPDQFARFTSEQWNNYRHPDDLDRPSPLLHHLVWLKHAGFAAVDCFWMYGGHAIFGGFKQGRSAGSELQSRADS